jgi:hypothetical protein
MRINWGRGFFRAWVVLALAWIGLVGWNEFVHKPWNMDWRTETVRTEGECWDRLAKWPDGQPFSMYNAWSDEIDIPANVEVNKREHAWAADSIPERNRWVHATLQKLRECEAAAPIMQRVSLRATSIATNIWFSLKDSLALILLPPCALLITGYIFGWTIRGFRAGA